MRKNLPEGLGVVPAPTWEVCMALRVRIIPPSSATYQRKWGDGWAMKDAIDYRDRDEYILATFAQGYYKERHGWARERGEGEYRNAVEDNRFTHNPNNPIAREADRRSKLLGEGQVHPNQMLPLPREIAAQVKGYKLPQSFLIYMASRDKELRRSA
jgi:hypothetical protein